MNEVSWIEVARFVHVRGVRIADVTFLLPEKVWREEKGKIQKLE
jgi:hypothetical protein